MAVTDLFDSVDRDEALKEFRQYKIQAESALNQLKSVKLNVDGLRERCENDNILTTEELTKLDSEINAVITDADTIFAGIKGE